AQSDKALDATYETAKRLLAEKGFVLYFWSENGFRDFATKDKFIRVPSDLSGMKMRAQESFVHTSMYSALGAKPNAIPVPQVAEDLANGVVSGYDNTKLYSYAAQWYTHVKYLTSSHHIYQPAIIAYNKKWLESLPKDLQDILLEDVVKHTKRGRKQIRAMDRSMDALFKQGGVEFYTPTAGERAKMKKATASVYTTFRKRVGAAGSALLDEILKAI
ncbi:MAG: TRAP-type C4-dicarboxylate transport system substrate-binding protein, partial [Myxococcota bacterium]